MYTVIKQEDNSVSANDLLPNQEQCLSAFAGVSLCDLCEKNKGFLVFPHTLSMNQDDIEDRSLFDIRGKRLVTGNVIGYFGTGDIRLAIKSRFDSTKSQYFLHYMLQRVLGINLIDLSTGTSEENLWDLLVYLFPAALKGAFQQGLFRSYKTHFFSDAKLRGTVDVPRFIKNNIPFLGKISYYIRERSGDNDLTQLIRHTIEVIKANKKLNQIFSFDSEFRSIVDFFVQITPSYKRADARKIIATNLRPVRHPFFSCYTFLQKICLQILRGDKISYGENDNQLYGVVFDAAWLWEEYLATILIPLGVSHPKNKTGEGAIYLYKTPQKKPVFPDFISDNMIIDAKYKRLDSAGIKREDRYQIISYMHITKSMKGVLIFPTQNNDVSPQEEGDLNGYGGIVGTIPFHVPLADDREQFCCEMQKEEQTLQEAYMSFLNKELFLGE